MAEDHSTVSDSLHGNDSPMTPRKRGRGNEGKAWSEIKKILEEFTGVALGGSTAQVRYGRMKANFVVFEKDDEPALLESKKEIEDKFEIEMWQKIADAVEVKRGSKYPSSTVQKFKELSKRASAGNGVTASPVNGED